MSVLDEGASSPLRLARERTAGGRIVRWLPAAALVVAAVGAVAVLPVIDRDAGARDWYRGRFGGSPLYTADAVFALLLPFLISAGIAVALLQRERGHKAAVAKGGSIQRHEWTEVVIHWLNAVGMVLCLFTSAWLLRWFDNPFSLEMTYVIHFAGAAMIVVAVAHHLSYQLVGGGAGLLPRSRADVKNAAAEIAGYTGVYRGLRGAFNIQLPLAVRRPVQRVLRRLNLAPEPAGKYLATEKVISYTIWSVLIGVVLLTGIVKTVNYAVLMPSGLLDIATFLHDGATIFIIVFLAIHVGALVLVPRNWPLLKSMFTTRISREYVERHLPLWREGNSK